MGGSTSHLSLRFACFTLVIVGVVGVLAALAGRELARREAEESVAASTARLLGEPVAAAIEGTPFDAEVRARLDAFTENLPPGGIQALRVRSADGEVIYDSGVPFDAGSVDRPASGVAWHRAVAQDGEDLFVTSVGAAPYVVEIAERAEPLDTRIARVQLTAMVTTALATFLLFLLVQGAFRIVVRSMSSEHGRLTRLFVAGESLRGMLDQHDVLTKITRDAANLSGADFSLISLYDHESGDLVLRATYEQATGTISHHQRAVEEWSLRRAVATNSTIIGPQPASAFRQFFGPSMDLERNVYAVCLPMSLRDRVIGAVALVRLPASRRGRFTQDEATQVSDLAAQGAMAVEQAQLFAKVRSYANEVEVSYDSTLKALMAALDAKDQVTEGHCERVAKLTVHLARQLDVPEPDLLNIERGALLHDVGKIGVPDAVLKKPEALNDAEWEAMRKHPLLAGVMISKVGFLEGATPILLYHHERWDGGGYPFGLSHDQIPIEARIFSVIDSYDAMTSHRPYRSAMRHDEAMAEVRAHAGAQFDPDVVIAFERLMASRPELHAQESEERQIDDHHLDFDREHDLPDREVA